MPPNPAEPEKYSLDDMLDRLQSKPADVPESGELVTRSDGTQAIKVRKRKRRSTQPHKEAAKHASRIRVIQISAAITLLVLLGLAFGGLIVYGNSAPYRQSITTKFESATGAKSIFLQFRVNPTAADVVRTSFNWPEGNALKSLSLVGVHAKTLLGGLIRPSWSVDEISASAGTLNIGAPKIGTPVRFSPPPSGPSPVSAERIGVSALDITLGNPASPVIQILRSEASFYPRNVNGRPAARLFRGDVKIQDWPDFSMNRALLEFHGSETEIVSMRLLHELDTTGHLDLSGRFDPYAIDKNQELTVKIENFNLVGIIGPSMGHLLSGRIDTRDAQAANKLIFSSGTPTGHLSAAFTGSPSSPLGISSFQFLSDLSKYVENSWFIGPIFDDGSSGILHRESGVIRLTDLSLIARNHLKITGELALQANDNLSGTLQIGLPEALMIATKDRKLKSLFKDSHDGYRWVTVKISGTGLHPLDNFAATYASSVAESAASPAGDAFENLTAPKPTQ